MTRVSRTRTFDARLAVTGVLYTPANGRYTWRTASRGWTGTMTDKVGKPWTDSVLSASKSECMFPVLSGVRPASEGGGFMAGFPIDFRPNPKSALAVYPHPSSSDWTNLGTQICARTNVSTPVVNLPAFIGELKDYRDLTRWENLKHLPNLVRDWGGNLIRKVAKGNITWQFALKPMINDVMKMFKFQESCYQRFLYLNRLLDGKSVRRRCTFAQDACTIPATSRTTCHSIMGSITAYRDCTYTKSSWGTVRWHASAGSSYMPKDVMSQYDLSRRMYYGITGFNALRTAWELTPWSWFVDWFWDIGSYLDSINNTVPATASGFCYMQTTTSLTSYRAVVASPWIRAVGPYFERSVVKYRYPPGLPLSLPPLPSLPALTSRQWSILGSIAALRGFHR